MTRLFWRRLLQTAQYFLNFHNAINIEEGGRAKLITSVLISHFIIISTAICRLSNIDWTFIRAAHQPSKTEAQMEDEDALLKCFSPLFNSLRLFGLYFTRPGTRRVHHTSSPVMSQQECVTSQHSPVTSQSETAKKWNAARVYAVFWLVVSWLNAARMLSIFDKSEKFGVALLLKLPMTASGLGNALLPTACFVACQTGNLDRVFRDAVLSKSDIARYRRLAVIHTIVCWVLTVVEFLVFFVPTFRAGNELSSVIAPFGVHISISDQRLRILAETMIIPMSVHGGFTWYIWPSVNYMPKIIQSATGNLVFFDGFF